MEREYSEKIIECIDKYFPKGDKRRVEALVLQAVAYLEGKEHWIKTVLEIIDKEMKATDILLEKVGMLKIKNMVKQSHKI